MSTTTGTIRERPAPLSDRHAERVVLATDGGLAGLSAMRWIADRAATHALEVTALDVVDVPERPGWDTGRPHWAADRAVNQVTDYLHSAAASVVCTASVVAGDPLTRITAAAEDADLLVLGTNRVGMSRHLVASFSTKVAQAASCPTVVVPRGWERSGGPVVLGVEGDGSDDGALDFAAHEAEVLGRELVLVHAWQLTGTPPPGYAAEIDRKAAEAAAGGRLSAVLDRAVARYPHLRVAPLLEHDAPVAALVRAEQGASLIVVGSHGLSRIDRDLSDSVSRGVLERPSCPVAIVTPDRVAG
jgi:nucleotide-binding universal stress UspA family protein